MHWKGLIESLGRKGPQGSAGPGVGIDPAHRACGSGLGNHGFGGIWWPMPFHSQMGFSRGGDFPAQGGIGSSEGRPYDTQGSNSSGSGQVVVAIIALLSPLQSVPTASVPTALQTDTLGHALQALKCGLSQENLEAKRILHL